MEVLLFVKNTFNSSPPLSKKNHFITNHPPPLVEQSWICHVCLYQLRAQKVKHFPAFHWKVIYFLENNKINMNQINLILRWKEIFEIYFPKWKEVKTLLLSPAAE